MRFKIFAIYVLCLSCLLVSVVDCRKNGAADITLLEGSATAIKLNWTCNDNDDSDGNYNVSYNEYSVIVRETSTILFNLNSTDKYDVVISTTGDDDNNVCCTFSFNISELPTFSPPDSANQVERVWATLEYPYENINSEMFSAQIVWTPLPGVTQYEVIIQNFRLENILGSPFYSQTTFLNIISSNSRYPLKVGTEYIVRVQGVGCSYTPSEPIVISSDIYDSELIMIGDDSVAENNNQFIQIHLQDNKLVQSVSSILGPVAIDKRNRKIFYGIQEDDHTSIMMDSINNLGNQTEIYRFSSPVTTVYAMAYDWVANELYVAVCRGGHLVVIGITVHTMKECNSNTLRNYYVPDSVELTINPFTRLLHWSSRCTYESQCIRAYGHYNVLTGSKSTQTTSSYNNVPANVVQDIYAGCVYYITDNGVVRSFQTPGICHQDFPLDEYNLLTLDPVSFYALSIAQSKLLRIDHNDTSNTYDFPFGIANYDVSFFESLSIGTQPLTNDVRCLTPASLEIQVAAILRSTLASSWAVQWNCPNYSYSRPPVEYTIFVESSDGPVDGYHNKIMYTSYIEIPVSSNTNYGFIVEARTPFTTGSPLRINTTVGVIPNPLMRSTTTTMIPMAGSTSLGMASMISSTMPTACTSDATPTSNINKASTMSLMPLNSKAPINMISNITATTMSTTYSIYISTSTTSTSVPVLAPPSTSTSVSAPPNTKYSTSIPAPPSTIASTSVPVTSVPALHTDGGAIEDNQSQMISIIAGSAGGTVSIIVITLLLVVIVAVAYIKMRKRKTKHVAELEVSDSWISSGRALGDDGTRYVAACILPNDTNVVLQNPLYDMPPASISGRHHMNTNGTSSYAAPNLNQYMNTVQQYEVPSQTSANMVSYMDTSAESKVAQNGLSPSLIRTQKLRPRTMPAHFPSQPQPYSTPVPLTNTLRKSSKFNSCHSNSAVKDPLYLCNSQESNATVNCPNYIELEQPSAKDDPQERVYFELENTESPKENIYFELEDPNVPERLYFELANTNLKM